jgi:hypothetical protein
MSVSGNEALLPVAGRKKQVRSTPDWIAVGQDYRTGELSLRQLAAKHRCSRSSVANKARREGWVRACAGIASGTGEFFSKFRSRSK